MTSFPMFTPSQRKSFTEIASDEGPDFREGKDCFIGDSMEVSLAVPEGSYTGVRDLVVRGSLTIEFLEEVVTKPAYFTARDVVVVGELKIAKGIDFRCKRIIRLSKEKFHLLFPTEGKCVIDGKKCLSS